MVCRLFYIASTGIFYLHGLRGCMTIELNVNLQYTTRAMRVPREILEILALTFQRVSLAPCQIECNIPTAFNSGS